MKYFHSMFLELTHELGIIDLPQCVLMAVFGKLSYTELLNVGKTCRYFKEISASVFDHGFLKLKPLILNMLRKVEQEQENWSSTSMKHKTVLLRSHHLLGLLLQQTNLIRAMGFRTLFLSNQCLINGIRDWGESLQDGATLLDEVYEILKTIAKRKVCPETMDVTSLQGDVEQWLDNYHDKFEPILLLHPSVRPECRSAIFGSRIIDLLECFEGCERKIETNVHNGWCHMKGTYKIPRVFFTCVINPHAGREDEEPLSFREQRCLHDSLRSVVMRNNDFHYDSKCATGISPNYSGWASNRRYVGMYQGTNQCGAGNLYFYGYFSRLGMSDQINDGWIGVESLCEVTFHIDLVCRMELAPVEMMLDWDEEQRIKQDEQEESPDSEEETLDPDLTLRLSIDCPIAGTRTNRLSDHYSCLIQHKIQRDNTTVEVLSTKQLEQIHEQNLQLENKVRRIKLQEYELPNSLFYV